MPAPWRRLDQREVLRTPVFGLECHRVVSPRTGCELDMYVLNSQDYCNIVPITPDGQVVMVRQHRHGTGESTLEIPGGLVDPHDASPLAAARRELEEETGFQAGEIVPTGVIAPNPAMMNNRCHSFLARDVRKVGEPQLDDGEDIEVVLMPLAEIPERVARGEFSHSLVVVAFTFAFGLKPPI
jgi:8-oxo-dGTP pyrophosphatase MutT (NUDIX family)